ncbi:MAG: rod shape-determining protein MreC [Opitutaceae bacterium]|nr:rod shape-determining protein MreC [Opitutaceae bacterium]
MPRKHFLQARPFLALGLIVVAWLVLPLVVKSLARVSFYEFQAPALLSASYLRDLQDYWALRVQSKDELIAAGRDIAHTNARYELGIRENEALRAEVERLERLLNLPVHTGYRYEIARVARRDFSIWWQQLWIRKGTNHGIPVGAPVVYTGGVVGRVREVHATTAVVDLISSPNIRLAATFAGDNRPVAYLGVANPQFANPHGRVQFVPGDIAASAAAPAQLVTSGLGGIFPPGLVIGRIQKLTIGPDGQFKEGEVILDERLSSLSEVAVLVPIDDL